MPNNLVILILDSCRFDSFVSARTPNFSRLGTAEPRYSYASWTSPSHHTYLMGLLPHQSPKGVFASEVYKTQFSLWIPRLGIEGLSFKTFLPQLSLPRVLQEHGYRTVARVSLPVLNSFTSMNTNFDEYKLMDDHNDFAGIVEDMEFSPDAPSFYFLNLGETHYPYMLDPKSLPHISGVHGIFKRLDDIRAQGEGGAVLGEFFDAEQMAELHQQQIRCVEYIDGVFEALLDRAPVDTHFIVMSDHGELFGESGYFGHGPIVHEKVFEVPLLEGKKR